ATLAHRPLEREARARAQRGRRRRTLRHARGCARQLRAPVSAPGSRRAMSQPTGAPRRLRLGAVLLPLGMLLGCASALGAQLEAGVPQQPLSRLVWSSDATLPSRFISAHGRRAALFGYSENGLEAWAYPPQLLHGYRVSFRQQAAATEIAGQAVLRRITYSPQAVTRAYVGPDLVVREELFVPLELPGRDRELPDRGGTPRRCPGSLHAR